jgi:hypothetical protein
MSGHQATPPAAVERYFGAETVRADHPIIAQQFRPGRGWTRYPIRKRISPAWARKIRRDDGVTAVALACAGRLADFQIEELTR